MTKAEIEARIARKKVQLELANDTLDELLSEAVISYKLDTGEGAQQEKQRKIEDLRNAIKWLEEDIAKLESKLNRSAVITQRLRRY